jgi:prophage antirepressor-like protein
MPTQQFNTSTQLVPFQFENTAIRVIQNENREPWWSLQDVCKALTLENPTVVASRLRPHETTILSFSENGIPHRLLLVNESGLYRIIMRSNKPEAERFQDWVFEEVLPQIRKTGHYGTDLFPEEKAVRQLEALLHAGNLFDTPLHLVQQEAVKQVEATHHVNLHPFLLAAPAQNNIPTHEMFLEPTELAPHLKERSGKAMNLRLMALGLQERDDGGSWTPTAKGRPLCLRHAWTKAGKTGYNWKWNVEKVRQFIQRG